MVKANRSEYYKKWRNEKKYGKELIATKRVCATAGCETTLNSYNQNPCCSLHNFAYITKNKNLIDY